MASNSHQGGGGPQDKGKRLRRPHATTQERLRNGEIDQNQNIPIVKKSTLSASAPEFVPKNAVVVPDAQSTSGSTQDVLYQDFQRLVSIRPSHLSGVTTGGAATKDSPADMFKNAVFELTSNPGPMEEYLKPIVDTLKRGVTDIAVLNEIIETLFEQSVSESNFRFTGAKICKYLSEELKSHHVFNNFRGLYLNRCKQEFDKREELLNNNLTRLCGLSMYFGELFLILEIEKDGVLTKVGILRSAIADLLRTLLSKLDDDTVKCATQLIKLTGPALMQTKDLPGTFDDIFEKIKRLEKHPSLNKTSHCLVNSVLSRLEYNFGLEEQLTQPTSVMPSSYNPNYHLNEPIFYNSQGQTITREEAGFCQDESDYEGMNNEEQEAFLQWEAENFVNQQQQQYGDQYIGHPYDQAQYGDPWIGQGGDNYDPGSGLGQYAQWSSESGQVDFSGYDDGEIYSDCSGDMDDEMAAAYEMFLQQSGQQHQQ